MAAYSEIPVRPMQDLSNFFDDLPSEVTNGSILDATRMVLEEDNTAEWIVDMLTLTRYYRVNFKKRKTVEKFIHRLSFLTENKENQVSTGEQLTILHKVSDDLTKCINKNKCDCLDDSHWPVSSTRVWDLRSIYTAFPEWENPVYN